MKSVEYKEEVAKKGKGIKYIIIALLIVAIIIFAVFLSSFSKNRADASKKEEDISVTYSNNIDEEKQSPQELSIERNKNVLNIKNILNENTKNVETKTLVVDEMDLDYKTVYKENSKLPSGAIQTLQDGIDGKQQVIVVKTYSGTEYIGEERVTSQVTKGSVDKIVEIGTGKEEYTYVPKVGDKVVVTPATLVLRKINSDKSDEVCSLKKDDEVRIVEIVDSWYKVQYKGKVGFAQSNCFVYKGEPEVTEFEDGVEYTKEQLMKSLDPNMNLMKPSGLTLAQFKKVLSGNPGDKKHVIEDNAKYFYYAEKQYGLNGIFLASMAIHEGGWGTSKISKDKKNLFGYGAYDRNPYGDSFKFETYAEGIDLVARALVKYYLNEKGTKIYGKEKAAGTYYNGPTLKGVNKRYATDKNWHNATYKWMKYLYNRL